VILPPAPLIIENRLSVDLYVPLSRFDLSGLVGRTRLRPGHASTRRELLTPRT
jgi:hypothetical protein